MHLPEKSHGGSVAGPGWGAGPSIFQLAFLPPLLLPALPVSQDKSLSALTSHSFLSLCPFLQPPLLPPGLRMCSPNATDSNIDSSRLHLNATPRPP